MKNVTHEALFLVSCNFCSENRASAGKKRVVKILTKTEATRAFDEKIG